MVQNLYHFIVVSDFLKRGYLMKQSQIFMMMDDENLCSEGYTVDDLLIQGCFLRPYGDGIYAYLPLGLKLMNKIVTVIREEMEQLQAVEVETPILQEEKCLKKLGIHTTGVDTYQLTDRYSERYIVGGLHEEMVVATMLENFPKLELPPSLFYQITTYLKDYEKSEQKMIYSKERKCFEAYFFHNHQESFLNNYEQLKNTMSTLFTKLHVKQFPVVTYGHHGLIQPYHFIAEATDGEMDIASGTVGDFSALLEEAPTHVNYPVSDEVLLPIETFEMEAQKATFMQQSNYIRTLLFKIDEQYVVTLCRGDYEVNSTKLKHVLQANELAMASPEEVLKVFTAHEPYIGPRQLPIGLTIIADYSVTSIVNGITGANVDGIFFKNVNPERDFAITKYADIRKIVEGEEAPGQAGVVQFLKGHDIARIERKFIKQNDSEPIVGTACIDLTTLFVVLAEQHSDKAGFCWPKSLAPYDVHILVENSTDQSQLAIANSVVHLLKSYRYEVLLDDREATIEKKQKEADFIGIPIQLVIGDEISDNVLNVKFRKTGEEVAWQLEEVTEKLQAYFLMSE